MGNCVDSSYRKAGDFCCSQERPRPLMWQAAAQGFHSADYRPLKLLSAQQDDH